MRNFWREMTRSAYGSFTNNARFNWQQRPVAGRVPTMGINEHYYRAIESFLSCDIRSELYRTDAIALAAFYLAAKADDLLDKINWAYVAGNTSEVPAFERQFLNLLAEADCLRSSVCNGGWIWPNAPGRAPKSATASPGSCAGWSPSGEVRT